MKIPIHYVIKKFAHHSNYSGYDRILDFVPHSSLPYFPAHYFFGNIFKDSRIEACQAKWDHYGRDEINTELDIAYFPSFIRKHVYHFLYGENTFCYAADHRRRNKLLVATYHQPESWFKSSGQMRYDYFTSRIALLDGIIAVSANQAKFFSQFNKNVFCVHHGIDVDFFRPDPNKEPTPNVCLFVGNWLRDFSTLKECSILLKNIAPEIKLQVVTPEKNRHLLEGAEVEIFSGIDDCELREKYRSASVCLLPLLDCTANNSALEAMACGLPLVVSDIGGIRDYVTDDIGIFCAPGNAEEMVNAVLVLLRQKERRDAMAKKARQRAVELFAWPVVGKQLLDAYNSLISAL
jgi:glycosyltransferase involved in cell wall biosynthesis